MSLGSISEASFSALSQAELLICSSDMKIISLDIWYSASRICPIVNPDSLLILEWCFEISKRKNSGAINWIFFLELINKSAIFPFVFNHQPDISSYIYLNGHSNINLFIIVPILFFAFVISFRLIFLHLLHVIFDNCLFFLVTAFLIIMWRSLGWECPWLGWILWSSRGGCLLRSLGYGWPRGHRDLASSLALHQLRVYGNTYCDTHHQAVQTYTDD